MPLEIKTCTAGRTEREAGFEIDMEFYTDGRTGRLCLLPLCGGDQRGRGGTPTVAPMAPSLRNMTTASLQR